jgi:hypothetical protein
MKQDKTRQDKKHCGGELNSQACPGELPVKRLSGTETIHGSVRIPSEIIILSTVGDERL